MNIVTAVKNWLNDTPTNTPASATSGRIAPVDGSPQSPARQRANAGFKVPPPPSDRRIPTTAENNSAAKSRHWSPAFAKAMEIADKEKIAIVDFIDCAQRFVSPHGATSWSSKAPCLPLEGERLFAFTQRHGVELLSSDELRQLKTALAEIGAHIEGMNKFGFTRENADRVISEQLTKFDRHLSRDEAYSHLGLSLRAEKEKLKAMRQNCLSIVAKIGERLVVALDKELEVVVLDELHRASESGQPFVRTPQIAAVEKTRQQIEADTHALTHAADPLSVFNGVVKLLVEQSKD